jgi:hypothetical protein
MIAEFISRHLVRSLPESLEDLAERNDSTVVGRRFLVGFLFAYSAATAFLVSKLFL